MNMKIRDVMALCSFRETCLLLIASEV